MHSFVSRTSTAHRSAEKEGGGARVFIYLEIKKASTIRETSRMLPYMGRGLFRVEGILKTQESE